jgi:ketosteroid isomerase-like protein
MKRIQLPSRTVVFLAFLVSQPFVNAQSIPSKAPTINATTIAATRLHTEIEATLARFNGLVSRRDMAVVAEFADDALLVGSDDGEMAEGPKQLENFFHRVFSWPIRVSWEWRYVRAGSSGNIAWFFAEGDVVEDRDGAQKRKPYRLAGILRQQRGKWIWLQWNGSEPMNILPRPK